MRNESRERRLREIVGHVERGRDHAMDISYLSVADVGVQMFVDGFTCYLKMMGMPEPPDTILNMMFELALRAMGDACDAFGIPVERLGMHVVHLSPTACKEITDEFHRLEALGQQAARKRD